MLKMTDDDRAIRDLIAGACMAALNARFVTSAVTGDEWPADRRAGRAFNEADAFMAERAKRLAAEHAPETSGPLIAPNEGGRPTPWRVDQRPDGSRVIRDARGAFLYDDDPERLVQIPMHLLPWIVAMVNSCAD